MKILRRPKLTEMLEACKDNVVVEVFEVNEKLEEHLITRNTDLACNDVLLLNPENIDEGISVAYWTHTPRTQSHMCVDWRLLEA